MIAYPTHSGNALLERPTRDRTPSVRHPRRLRGWAGRAGRVGAVLLLAGLSVYCAHLGEAVAWSSLKGASLPLVAAAVVGISLAVAATLKAAELLGRLRQLTAAIEADTGEGTEPVLSEDGPPALARLARAINAAARHRAGRQAELLQVLAAYAHDQRTPLTRMGMRCELLEDAAVRDALQRDLAEMAQLVEASVSCAKLQCSAGERTQRVDADNLLGTLVGDYREAGRTVALEGSVGRPLVTCPHALRRVPAQMDAVFAPWYRSPETSARAPGSGLGLAIARRLTLAMRGELQLENRCAGGLEARLTLPLATA
ncbi:sensor histidine kinase [Paraburkholderia caledonica]|uniref:sensor histidine kinase n=1 Tax=Paraburkholderia caledonica TaxID=134536 RepID=UPI0038B8E541